jgi:glycogen operon protein
MVNAWWEPLEFQLPPTREIPGGRWRRFIDTSMESPADIVPLDQAPAVEKETYHLPPRSLAVMVARSDNGISS